MNAIRSTSSRCVLLAALGLAFFVSPAGAADLLLRSTGHLDFSNHPIPADYFGPGSLPFVGIVPLVGVPTGPYGADTIFSIGPLSGGSETVAFEMTLLHLQSVAPLEATFADGSSSFHDVSVDLSPIGPPSVGVLELQDNGPAANPTIIRGERFPNVDITIGGVLDKLTIMEDSKLTPQEAIYIFSPTGVIRLQPIGNMRWRPVDESGLWFMNLKPVPEPASMVLAGGALAVVWLHGRRIRPISDNSQ